MAWIELVEHGFLFTHTDNNYRKVHTDAQANDATTRESMYITKAEPPVFLEFYRPKQTSLSEL